jgi:hypothetical protein
MEINTQDLKQRIREVLKGCREGRCMDTESLHAAVLLQAEVESLQATIRLLQQGEVHGSVDYQGEVVLHLPEGVEGSRTGVINKGVGRK